MRVIKCKRINWKSFSSGCFIVVLCYIFGLDNYLGEKDFETKFIYPYYGDIIPVINQMKDGLVPSVLPINSWDYSFLITPPSKCSEPSTIRLLYVIKSSVDNFRHRAAIRKSWGFERRFSDVPIRTVFMLGHSRDVSVNQQVHEEASKYHDIIQAKFIDTYFNNTIKSVMSFKWVINYCPQADFIMFADDDMYISTKNVLRFLRSPSNYPGYLKKQVADETMEASHGRNELYAGYVFRSSPLRQRFSKWYISLEEYPYDKWPPYITGGAFVLSNFSLKSLYYGCLFTKKFRFDDVFLGIVSYKAKINLHHVEEINYYCHDVADEYLIACHGFKDPRDMLSTWQQQFEGGFV